MSTNSISTLLRAQLDEYKRRAELWERLHDQRTQALRACEAKLSKVLDIRFDYDGYKSDQAVRKILDDLTTAIAEAADARSHADLAASGGIVDAP